MQLIKNNPYRIVGLLANSTTREQTRQVGRLQQFIHADQEPEDDFSFPNLGKFERTIEKVTDAASKLNLDSDKMSAALFWFCKGSEITDEPAFNFIKENNIDNAIVIWRKLVAGWVVTEKNWSAFQNLSTLLLIQGVSFNQFGVVMVNSERLIEALNLKLKFLESDFANNLKTVATDVTFKITKKELQLFYLNEVYSSISGSGQKTENQFIEALMDFNFIAKDEFLTGFVNKPIEQIEKQIEAAKKERKANSVSGLIVGNKLYNQTSDGLSRLRDILGTSSMKYTLIADKISEEILNCAIGYFNHFQDSLTDPGSSVMELIHKAAKLACGNIAKQRCQEQIENVREWIDEKPEREKKKKIFQDLEKLKNLIDSYEKKNETISNGSALLEAAKPYLNNLKSILGITDELYLGFSTRIASDAQGMCISEINSLQDRFSSAFDNNVKLLILGTLRLKVVEAYNLTTTIGTMDLKPDFRLNFNTNRNSISELKSTLNSIGAKGTAKKPGKSGGGCYIASMAYGSYEHPQVLKLRKFRDAVLSKSDLGQWFIKAYYYFSPKLVDILKDNKTINHLIRKLLDQVIKLIKK